jgi:hypothetical protein
MTPSSSGTPYDIENGTYDHDKIKPVQRQAHLKAPKNQHGEQPRDEEHGKDHHDFDSIGNPSRSRTIMASKRTHGEQTHML